MHSSRLFPSSKPHTTTRQTSHSCAVTPKTSHMCHMQPLQNRKLPSINNTPFSARTYSRGCSSITLHASSPSSTSSTALTKRASPNLIPHTGISPARPLGTSKSERASPSFVPHASSSQTAAVQPQNRQDNKQDTKQAFPTFLERCAAALMFLLPYSECMYRLALLFVGFCRHSALDLLVWCRVQYNTISSALVEVGGAASQQVLQELQACQMAMSWCQVLYTHFNNIASQLMDLSHQTLSSWSFTALQQPLGQWASQTFSTPFSLWDLSCIAYMVLLAQSALTQLQARKRASKKDKGTEAKSDDAVTTSPARTRSKASSSSAGSLSPLISSFLPTLLPPSSSSSSSSSPSLSLPVQLRRPDLLLVSFACALLLRISCVPLVGVSGVAPDLYQPAMVLLTAATAFISLAAITRLLLDRTTPLEDVMTELVRGVLGLTVWHRTLLLMDWILMFFGPAAGLFKVQVTACFVCYLLMLERLTNVAQEYVHKVAV